MKIHEYQAKAILARHGVPVPRGDVTSHPSESADTPTRPGRAVVVLKAHMHSGCSGHGRDAQLPPRP